MIFKYKFCLWLIDTLTVQPLTLREIQKKWLNSSANTDGDPLAERTFIRYCKQAESLMCVDIKCDKRDGNLYKIVRPDGFKDDELQQWLLSAFRLSNLAERANKRKEVMIEAAPPAAHLLKDMIDAIDDKHSLRVTYKSHYKEAEELVIYPAFVRLFKQRWYLIGEVKGVKKTRTLALERMISVEILSDEKFKFSSASQKILQPEKYFEHCFGVIRQYDPIRIKLRAFWPQDAYLKDTPLHSSQVEVEHTPDYTDFEIYVRPTYDLKQELLWQRDKVAVLSPESFRQDMMAVLRATLAGYETGESHSIDE